MASATGTRSCLRIPVACRELIEPCLSFYDQDRFLIPILTHAYGHDILSLGQCYLREEPNLGQPAAHSVEGCPRTIGRQ